MIFSVSVKTSRASYTRVLSIRAMSAFAATQATAKASIGGATSRPQHTLTGLKRWSCTEKKRIPDIQSIKSIHVYDFDNTLFASPLPNRQVWSSDTIGRLANPDLFLNGGWWHDASILAATGEGVEVEEPRAWQGWWNEQIVELVQLSMQQKDVLSVMLTGRAEGAFSELILRMLKSKALDFDLVCLKPAVGPSGQKFTSTMLFKQELLRDLVFTYRAADEIRVYEDRPKHTAGFRNFFTEFNASLMSPDPPISRKTINAEVVQVPENAKQLDPVLEVEIVQRSINSHNLAIRNGSAPKNLRPLQIKRTVLYTGYLLPAATSQDFIRLANLPKGKKERVKILASNILITARPASHSLMRKVGGVGAHMRWRAISISSLGGKIWAARVQPAAGQPAYHTDTPTPMVVIALRGDARPADANQIHNWPPLPNDQSFEFDTTVGEKVLLGIEQERDPQVLNWRNENMPPHKKQKMNLDTNDIQEFPTLGAVPPKGPAQMTKGQGLGNSGRSGGGQNRGRGSFQRGGSRGGNRGAFRGGHGPGGGRGRARGGQNTYKSLDDVSHGDAGSGGIYDGY